MSFFYGINSNYTNSLFFMNSSSNKTNSAFGMTSLLSDYSAIKSGSYKKLLNAYYDKVDKGEVSGSISTAGDSTKKLAGIKGSAEDLIKSTETLTKGAAFKKVSSKDEKGNVIESYDSEKIYKDVKAFVDNYNELMNVTEDSNTRTVANNMKSIINMTDANEKLLGKIGISIDSDFNLHIDEEKFKKSDMSAVKSMFSGQGSYGYQVGVKASMVDMNAKMEAAKSNTYTNGGTYTYNYNAGSMYNMFF